MLWPLKGRSILLDKVEKAILDRLPVVGSTQAGIKQESEKRFCMLHEKQKTFKVLKRVKRSKNL